MLITLYLFGILHLFCLEIFRAAILASRYRGFWEFHLWSLPITALLVHTVMFTLKAGASPAKAGAKLHLLLLLWIYVTVAIEWVLRRRDPV